MEEMDLVGKKCFQHQKYVSSNNVSFYIDVLRLIGCDVRMCYNLTKSCTSPLVK